MSLDTTCTYAECHTVMLSVIILSVVWRLHDTQHDSQHNGTQNYRLICDNQHKSFECQYGECYYAEYNYAECRVFIAMLRVMAP